MHDDQPYRLAGWARIAIRGWDTPGTGQPAFGVKRKHHSFKPSRSMR